MEDKDSFPLAIAELIREAFEGKNPTAEGTWFVEGMEAILPSLNDLTAEQASMSFTDGGASVGAHTRHLVYIMAWSNACHGEAPPTGDWEDTWSQTKFSESEWSQLREELRGRSERFLTWMKTNENWIHEMGVIPVVAVLPHVAYHLGAIRQLMNLIAEPNPSRATS